MAFLMPEIFVTWVTGFVGKAVVQRGAYPARAVLIADLKDCVRNDK